LGPVGGWRRGQEKYSPGMSRVVAVRVKVKKPVQIRVKIKVRKPDWVTSIMTLTLTDQFSFCK
jgi:hypothetical protein